MRRVFTAEFKPEAVQWMQSRRADGVPLTQIARERDVSPDELRSWARQREREGVGPAPRHLSQPVAAGE
jgi:transposase-like protein